MEKARSARTCLSERTTNPCNSRATASFSLLFFPLPLPPGSRLDDGTQRPRKDQTLLDSDLPSGHRYSQYTTYRSIGPQPPCQISPCRYVASNTTNKHTFTMASSRLFTAHPPVRFSHYLREATATILGYLSIHRTVIILSNSDLGVWTGIPLSLPSRLCSQRN